MLILVHISNFDCTLGSSVLVSDSSISSCPLYFFCVMLAHRCPPFHQLSELRDGHRDLEVEFGKVVEERDQLYDTFEGAVRAVQQKSDFR